MKLSTVFICCQGWEENLVWELKRWQISDLPKVVSPGLVICEESPATLENDSIFCRQLLPHVQVISTTSAKKAVEELLDYVVPIVQDSKEKWAYRITTPDFFQEDNHSYEFVQSRAGLLEKLFLEEIRRYWPRLLKSQYNIRQLDKKPLDTFHGGLLFVQGIVVAKDKLYWSISKPSYTQTGRYLPVVKLPWQVAKEELAPCRSYYKLEEAWNELGTAPCVENICVDLGAAPGHIRHCNVGPMFLPLMWLI